jgi:formylmethanofuran dehydrogenase subunit E
LLDDYEAEQEKELSKLPECCYCGEHIQQDSAICINDEWYCDDCLNDNFRRSVESFIE